MSAHLTLLALVHAPAASGGGGPSAGALLLAVLAGLLALAAAAWLAMGALGVEPRWSLSLRHALAEAAARTAATLNEFADWVRLGR